MVYYDILTYCSILTVYDSISQYILVHCDIYRMCIIVYVLHVFQKKKAEGPAEPQQPAKKMKPPVEATPTVAMEIESCDPEVLKQQIDAQGGKVRELKSSGAEKVISLLQHVTIAGASGLGYMLFQLQLRTCRSSAPIPVAKLLVYVCMCGGVWCVGVLCGSLCGSLCGCAH